MTALPPSAGTDFQRTIEAGGIAIFPTDTLYGIACDPDDRAAIERIHRLKGRPPIKPSAVMYFSLERLLDDLAGDLDRSTLDLLERMLPGPYTFVVENRNRRFAASCADAPEKLGLRVPELRAAIAPLESVELPVMQTSANVSGAADVSSIDQLDRSIREGVDLVLDGGELPGQGSTVADVSELAAGRWQLLRSVTPQSAERLTEAIGFPPLET